MRLVRSKRTAASEFGRNRVARQPDSQFVRTTDRPQYADLAYAACVPEFHAEPYLHLAGLSHKSALIAWGAFYFKTRSREQWKLVDDRDLRHVHPPRRESIGAHSDPYGPARVNVYDEGSGSLVASSFTEASNYCWVAGLAPNTDYRYEVLVKGEPWGVDERWDWVRGSDQGLVQQGGRYVNRFRTHPDPTLESTDSFTFIVIGDFGTGILRSTPTRRQYEVAQAMQVAFEQHDVRMIVTTGDNIYAGHRILGMPIGATGDEDDDWFFTFFQPYRYMLNRIPVYPCIGNHDTAETEDRDDREQLLDNLYLRERIASDESSGRASMDPGLFYRFRYGRDVEFICIDTSKEDFFKGRRLFEYPKHWEWVDQTLVPDAAARWKFVFCHHPPFCAGPNHHNSDRMKALLPLFERAGVRVVLTGHEHNFQHSLHERIDYFVTGAGSKLDRGRPDRFAEAHTVSWSNHAHFLLVTIAGSTMTVRVIGEIDNKVGPHNDGLLDLPRYTPAGDEVSGPIVLQL
jgi:tartrate-resistant acid phosphatase type 5